MSEEIRIGVFVCDCGTNIAGVVNVPEVVAYARTLNHVAWADEGKWSCSVDYLKRMQDQIKEHRINRVVVASCTPRTHEPLFKRTTREAAMAKLSATENAQRVIDRALQMFGGDFRFGVHKGRPGRRCRALIWASSSVRSRCQPALDGSASASRRLTSSDFP